MALRSNDEEPTLPPRTSLFFGLAFLAQVGLFLSLLAWIGNAQEAVPASVWSSSSKPRAARLPAVMPHAVSSFGVAELDGWLYLFGGRALVDPRATVENP